ncbi:hypothetical protein EDC01DRAFT_645392, partial [Geopyxis carbonaria]
MVFMAVFGYVLFCELPLRGVLFSQPGYCSRPSIATRPFHKQRRSCFIMIMETCVCSLETCIEVALAATVGQWVGLLAYGSI